MAIEGGIFSTSSTFGGSSAGLDGVSNGTSGGQYRFLRVHAMFLTPSVLVATLEARRTGSLPGRRCRVSAAGNPLGGCRQAALGIRVGAIDGAAALPKRAIHDRRTARLHHRISLRRSEDVQHLAKSQAQIHGTAPVGSSPDSVGRSSCAQRVCNSVTTLNTLSNPTICSVR